ncbi:hypothetical protein [Flavivirga eckloniae]|nr:hypothetical protein [Flavivirga eckloniae]
MNDVGMAVDPDTPLTIVNSMFNTLLLFKTDSNVPDNSLSSYQTEDV